VKHQTRVAIRGSARRRRQERLRWWRRTNVAIATGGVSGRRRLGIEARSIARAVTGDIVEGITVGNCGERVG
jgi:hypothetical protein